MELINISDLDPLPVLGRSLYDPLTGTCMVSEGQSLSADALRTIRDAGIRQVAFLEPHEDPLAVAREFQCEEVAITSIESGRKLFYDLYDNDDKMVLRRGTFLSKEMVTRLANRGVHRVYIRHEPTPRHKKRLREVRARLAGEQSRSPLKPTLFAPEEVIAHPRDLNEKHVASLLDRMGARGDLAVVNKNPQEALLNFAQVVDALQARPKRTKEEYVALYRGAIVQTQRLLQLLDSRQPVEAELVGAFAERIVRALVMDKDLLLNALHLSVRGAGYLERHAVDVAVVAINIGSQAGYTKKQVVEIGYGALLADVGMLRVPPAIRNKQAALDERERLEVMRHTVYGIEQLQRMRNLPWSAPLVGFQLHERLDGSGYPHGKKRHGIHDFAKIAAIADTYHALVSPRPHRHALSPYRALEELLRMTASRKLDSRFTRNLLSALSLFPVGSWVRLNSGEVAKVIGAHPEAYTKPVVAILYDRAGKPVEPRRVDLAKDKDLEVTDVASVRDGDPMRGF